MPSRWRMPIEYDPRMGLRLPAGGGEAQVLATGQVAVEARLFDDRTDPGKRPFPLLRDRQSE